MKRFLSKTGQQTLDLAQKIGSHIDKHLSIALKGELGAGKTTFVQGLAKGLGISEKYYITSPTFNIINEYPARDLTLFHLDLYRLESVDELEYIGFEDLLNDNGLIVVEWPQLLESDGFCFDLDIQFDFDAQYHRTILVIPLTREGSRIVNCL